MVILPKTISLNNITWKTNHSPSKKSGYAKFKLTKSVTKELNTEMIKTILISNGFSQNELIKIFEEDDGWIVIT